MLGDRNIESERDADRDQDMWWKYASRQKHEEGQGLRDCDIGRDGD